MRPLCNLAKRKAELIENNVLAMRRAHWKEVIGVTVERGSSRAPRPTKAAYMYIRGTEGWTSSPVVAKSWNEVVPSEQDTTADADDNEQGVFDDVSTFVIEETRI